MRNSIICSLHHVAYYYDDDRIKEDGMVGSCTALGT
jgi:hypothetical protein